MIRQQKLQEFFISDHSSSSESEDDEYQSQQEQDQIIEKKRGRPREPLKWTRVFKITRTNSQNLQIYNIEKDQDNFSENYNQQEVQDDEDWQFIFHPQEFESKSEQLICKNYELNKDELFEFAKKASLIRQNLQKTAEQIALLEGEDNDKPSVEELKVPEKYRRSFQGNERQKDEDSQSEKFGLTYYPEKPRQKQAKNLSNLELLDVAHDAIVGLKSNSEISSKYQVKESFVSRLVFKIKQDKNYLSNKFDKEEKQLNLDRFICQVSQQVLDEDSDIWSASQIQEKLQQEHGLQATESRIRFVLKNQLKMKFKRIKRVPFLGNAQRCLVMRQQYGKKMLNILSEDKVIWNFDESFLKDSFFVRSKWCKPGEHNSIPKQSVSPRISVYLAMNNLGDAYLCLSQSKTDSEKVILFFEYFFQQLDLDQPDWREKSILLMDGAAYHKSDETTEFLRRNKVKVFVSAPYSYDAAFCEMWFSYFKSKNLNPEKLQMSKTQVSINFITLEVHFKMQSKWSDNDLME